MLPCMGTVDHTLARAGIAAQTANATQATARCRVRGRVAAGLRAWAASQARRSADVQVGGAEYRLAHSEGRESADWGVCAKLDRQAAIEFRTIFLFIHSLSSWPDRLPSLAGLQQRSEPVIVLKLGANGATHTSCHKVRQKKALRRDVAWAISTWEEKRQLPRPGPDIGATALRRGGEAAGWAGSL